ncbi:hypothetical protein KCU88_g438, partial [Aureobasidium melanogenum]
MAPSLEAFRGSLCGRHWPTRALLIICLYCWPVDCSLLMAPESLLLPRAARPGIFLATIAAKLRQKRFPERLPSPGQTALQEPYAARRCTWSQSHAVLPSRKLAAARLVPSRCQICSTRHGQFRRKSSS